MRKHSGECTPRVVTSRFIQTQLSTVEEEGVSEIIGSRATEHDTSIVLTGPNAGNFVARHQQTI